MTTPFEPPQKLSISIVERETGLSKDLLRIWERRYGFPAPERDTTGDRLYPREQVSRLRLIKRLIDSGLRPGKVVPQNEHKLLELAQVHGQAAAPPEYPHDLDRFILLLKKHDSDALKRFLNQQMVRLGIRKFVIEIVAPLNALVGEAWMRGELAVFEEHLYTEVAQNLLCQAVHSLSVEVESPRILLTTFPDEQHSLGLQMVEALLASESADCISMGIQMPVSEIAAATIAHRADVVALSFSGAYPTQMIGRGLKDLKSLLPEQVEVWAGGAGIASAKLQLDGVQTHYSLDSIAIAVCLWREKHHVRPALQAEPNIVRSAA
jgi:MerR family transcriptional regulator, light-induced transcriptional regulator